MAAGGDKSMQDELRQFIIPVLEPTGVTLGAGAYGEVIKMKMDGEAVAVKRLHLHFVDAPGWEVALKKFQEECVRLSTIRHPNIVRFLGVYYEGNPDIPMLVMEFIPTSLRKHIEEKGALGKEDRSQILLDVAQGLEYLHGLNPPLIHRDLTSNNILLTDNHHAKIADLGVSKFLTRRGDQTLTNVPGNLSHMPPEALDENVQKYRQSVDKATKLDIFSFGNVLINVIVGDFPVVDLRVKNVSEVERRKDLLDQIDDSTEKDLIVRCLHNNPDHRPSAKQLLQFFQEDPVEEEDEPFDDEEISLVTEPPFDLKCPLCLEVFQYPCQTSCCGRHLCSECGNQLKTNSIQQNCPYCREADFTLAPDKFFSRQIQSLKVQCYHARRGCPWTGELRGLKKHIEEMCVKNFKKCKHCALKFLHKALPGHMTTCTDFPLPCPNKCAKNTKRKDLMQHLERECSLRVISDGTLPRTANNSIQVVPLAVTMANFSQYALSGQIWYSPPFYTHKNGYKLCLRVDADLYKQGYVSVLAWVLKGEHDKKLNWPLHAEIEVALYNWKSNEPLYSQILCLPGDTFCSANTTDMPSSWGQGLVNFISHDSLASDTASYVQRDLLNLQITKVTFFEAPTIPQLPNWARGKCFVVPNFQYMKKNDIGYYGPIIYMKALQGVYKLCSCVHLDGLAGTHVAVSGALMKGEHDDVLPWPIQADISLTMLNWRENKNHIQRTLGLSHEADSKSASRVPITGIAEVKCMFPRLIAHSALPYNAATNKEYLKQGCLLFRIDSYLYADKAAASRLPPWVDAQTESPYPCFTLSEFSKRREHKNRFYSKPFFSHRNGYRMQIRVDASEGQHVGLFLYLMAGPNDNQLQWPFQGDVTVELVNWREDNGHLSKVISLPSKCTNSTTGERGSDGYFVSHAALAPDPAKDVEYLQNDALHFRVKEVAVFSTLTSQRTPAWQTRLMSFQFTVNEFTRRRALKNEFYSPAFYTHQGGYKFRLEVKSNEYKQAVSVFLRLLKGENDAALTWPFIGDIQVELLNWREDRNHHSEVIHIHERVCMKYGQCVEVGDSAESACGYPTFVTLAALGYSQISNTEYINGDCLCFRVSKLTAYSSPLAGKIPRWQPRDQPASFTITAVPQRRSMGNEYYSPPFYVAQYKMCLSVHLDGSNSQKGKHMSVYACLLRGEHDEKLEWPFRGDITVEVLNWRGDRDHFKEVLSLDEHNSCTNRVMTESNELSGCGKPSFMAILQSNNYLEDQCLRMRVSSVISYNGPLRLKAPSWQGSVLNTVLNPASMHSQIDFTITHFSSRFANKTTYKSLPFYTHSKGYKMRLEVDACGTGEGEGHMSVYATLMAGEYDASLKWPMRVDLTVQILNWVKNSFHILKTIKFKGEQDSCGQVSAKEEIASLSLGFHRFCAHTTLFGKRHNVKYVQEDCVRVRVKGHFKKVLGLF